jgi:hypothetical protein
MQMDAAACSGHHADAAMPAEANHGPTSKKEEAGAIQKHPT